VSRLCDRVPRRASPGLDTDLNGLGLSFLYPGNVRLSRNTIWANLSEFRDRQRPESIRKGKAVWRATDDRTSGYP
jgi:hypothetical protein